MSKAQKSSKSLVINLGLLAAAALIFVICMILGGGSCVDEPGEEAFVGTDTTAVTSIEGSNPDYEPWFNQLFAPPSAEVESGLFALQAALGAGVFGYALGALRRRRTTQTTLPGAGDDPR